MLGTDEPAGKRNVCVSNPTSGTANPLANCHIAETSFTTSFYARLQSALPRTQPHRDQKSSLSLDSVRDELNSLAMSFRNRSKGNVLFQKQ